MASSSSPSTSNKKMITMKAGDGATFEVEEKLAMQALTIKNMIDDDCANDTIPLPNITGKILAKVIEYCKKHAEDEKDEGEFEKWDKNFMGEIKLDPVPCYGMLYDVMLAANYMDIKELLNLTCQTVADMIKGKTPDEIRKTFNIRNDFTPEEEEEVRRENQWAFE